MIPRDPIILSDDRHLLRKVFRFHYHSQNYFLWLKISSKTFGDHKIEIFLIIDPLRKVISNLSDFFLLEKFHGFKKERLPPKKKSGNSWMYPGPNVSLWEIRIQALYSGYLWVIISKMPLIKLAWGSIQIAESLIVRMVKRNEVTHHPDCCAIFGWQ